MNDVLAPERESEVEQIVRSACAEGAKLDIVGGGAHAGLGRPRAGERSLSIAGLKGIVFYAPAEMTLCAKAGTTIDEVEAAVSEQGQILPFEPMSPRALWGAPAEPTLGGMVATNLSGPRRITAGAARDNVLGLRLVNGLGQALKCGGRVMKNVTGLDLTKLNCGAHGTLGVVTEATIKLAPRPEAETTLVMPGLDDTRAIEAMTRALGSPFGVSGAAWLQSGMGGDVARTLLRIEGFPESVNDRARRLVALLAEYAPTGKLEGEESAGLWRSVRDAEFVAEPRERAIWRVSVAPSQAAAFVARLGATALARCYDWGGGLVWVATDATEAAAANLRRALSPARGHATLMRASEALRAQAPVFEPPSDLELRLARGVKASFDPGGVLNFGRMYAGV
ncbi:MAG: FAD-binding protein [Roseiarcus sp.]|uniref:FAD-binding protein n=1 Tax=Roseiarcus sp. TaxID=1969460 RepID=UPI003C582058